MHLLDFLRTQVRANRLSNHRLQLALVQLDDEAFHARRTNFFPSLVGTLNHILLVDRYYLDCLHGRSDARDRALAHVEQPTAAAWAGAQRAEDERFISLLDSCTDGDLDRMVTMPRADHLQHDRLGHVVAHLLAHQVHHRGQVHAMLAGTPVPPPQLDEFLMPSEAHLREADRAALGWTEALLFPGEA
ncbi:MAG: DinB family protein [Rubrivivax sp.]